ncbi:hypothetical protein GGR42_000907 [Saonia flava]|uniref:Uncharacterized protein n=1 Tax=Saonia flava TaxID=523696 RepID=A0A846QXT5_9FLAO|nr:EboA domain-containing protein [Saonia flava]NJB70445.1 hypothetical protein [Saonia flava]
MQFKEVGKQLKEVLKNNLDTETWKWISDKISLIVENKSTKDLYLTYSLVPSKTSLVALDFSLVKDSLKGYFEQHHVNTIELVRIYLLIKVLEADNNFFEEKVGNLIQVADKTELETFLKYLILLPKPEVFKNVAVDALRTNIGSVFNAIALNNPYPALYFSEKQWNQMYLKTIFIESDLEGIMNVDERANADLARIISDYAHERWAAGRKIDPLFWRPVGKYLNGNLLKDMERLLNSSDNRENAAAVLSCSISDIPEARELIKGHPELLDKVENKKINWDTLNA